ncbi:MULTISPECIES: hypothetical protein [Exiguobacterium]|uniref:hypothetical protein n=1 Tax=Exiguobacterium TaxID=33986 RepID=UPI001BEB80E9|nr:MULTISPECIES: hypothetical protein [Exiguobacterium]MCT4782492.1 hypothetical protein [Exiguobacterium himgiriensis]
MKWKTARILTSLIVTIALAGCSVDPEATARYKQETPLEATVTVPDDITPGEPVTFEITLNEDAPDFVHLELQKKDGTLSYGMQEAIQVGERTYELTTSLKEDGLYLARVHAQADGSTIFPAKQFIVGELTEVEWAALYEGAAPVEAVTEPHH